jgi:D-3-phosphoglycerate dehydrogenase
MDAEFAPRMIYMTNEDKPGIIGGIGTVMGEAKVNIANFNLGRSAPGAEAIALLDVDGGVDEKVLADLRKLPFVKQAKALAF